jgi:hypothetical protein
VVNIDKHVRRFLIDGDRQHLHKGASRRRRANLAAYHAGLLNILAQQQQQQQESESVSTKTIVVLGRNWTHGWHGVTYDLLQRGVGVLLYEETGTSRNCADCTGLLKADKVNTVKYLCMDAIIKLKGPASRLPEPPPEPPPKPPPKPKPPSRDELFPPESNIEQSIADSKATKLSEIATNWLVASCDKKVAKRRARQQRGGVTAAELEGAKEIDLARVQEGEEGARLRKATVWHAQWSAGQLEALRKKLREEWRNELRKQKRWTHRQCNLIVLAVGRGVCKRAEEARDLCDDDELDSMLLATSLDNRGVLRALGKCTASTRKQPRGTLMAARLQSETFGMPDMLATVRGRQFWQRTSAMSNAQLERKVTPPDSARALRPVQVDV